jgi:autotransporter-associated beta strand protein
VGTIIFDNAAHSYTLVGSGSNSITMSSLSGEASITVNHGSHEISAPIMLASDTTVTVASASDSLTLSGDISDISGAGTGLTLEGGGALFLSGDNSYDGDTTVSSGTLYATNPDALPDGTSLIVGGDATSIFSGSAAAVAAVPAAEVAATVAPEPGTPALLISAMVMLALAVIHRRP